MPADRQKNLPQQVAPLVRAVRVRMDVGHQHRFQKHIVRLLQGRSRKRLRQKGKNQNDRGKQSCKHFRHLLCYRMIGNIKSYAGSQTLRIKFRARNNTRSS